VVDFFCIVDSERARHLSGYGTLRCAMLPPVLSFFQAVSHSQCLRISTIHHLALPPDNNFTESILALIELLLYMVKKHVTPILKPSYVEG
jgi:hypothetical protein